MERWLTAPLVTLLALLALGILGVQLVLVPLAAAEFGAQYLEIDGLIVCAAGASLVIAAVFSSLSLSVGANPPLVV